MLPSSHRAFIDGLPPGPTDARIAADEKALE